jgi:hypothetical protein
LHQNARLRPKLAFLVRLVRTEEQAYFPSSSRPLQRTGHLEGLLRLPERRNIAECSESLRKALTSAWIFPTSKLATTREHESQTRP